MDLSPTQNFETGDDRGKSDLPTPNTHAACLKLLCAPDSADSEAEISLHVEKKREIFNFLILGNPHPYGGLSRLVSASKRTTNLDVF
jgi:hypothetical protein